MPHQTEIRKQVDAIQFTLPELEIKLASPRKLSLATLGYGLLDSDILKGKSRYLVESDPLRKSIQKMLLPPSGRRKTWGDPKVSKLDAVTETFVRGAQNGFKGVALFHVMRSLTTNTYNYGEFLGDDHVSYTHRNAAARMKNMGLEYQYVPFPNGGPPQELLRKLSESGYGWEEFKSDYRDYLAREIVVELLSSIVRASNAGHLPILFCCEPYVDCFDQLNASEKAAYGCHRFLLVAELEKEVQAIDLPVDVQHLDPGAVRLSLQNP